MFTICSIQVRVRVCGLEVSLVVLDSFSPSLDNSSGNYMGTVEETNKQLANDEEKWAAGAFTIGAEKSVAEKIEYWSPAYVKHIILEAI